MRNNVSESPAFQELHDDPELVSDQEAVVHVHDVRVVVVAHDDDLKRDELYEGKIGTVRPALKLRPNDFT